MRPPDLQTLGGSPRPCPCACAHAHRAVAQPLRPSRGLGFQFQLRGDLSEAPVHLGEAQIPCCSMNHTPPHTLFFLRWNLAAQQTSFTLTMCRKLTFPSQKFTLQYFKQQIFSISTKLMNSTPRHGLINLLHQEVRSVPGGAVTAGCARGLRRVLPLPSLALADLGLPSLPVSPPYGSPPQHPPLQPG